MQTEALLAVALAQGRRTERTFSLEIMRISAAVSE
jgi:hypothetical protein